jgi:uracil-DNA glycosylase family 4
VKGFFSPGLWAGENPLHLLTPRCGECQLYKHCQHGKMPPTGKGRQKILIVGEAPGENEDRQNKQFVGETGQLLSGVLAELGVDMRRDCKLHNALACRPRNNRKPRKKEVRWCRPNLANLVNEFQPTLIIPLGEVAVRSVLMDVWKDDTGSVGRWVGLQIPLQKWNAWVCPSYHPSYVSREKKKPVVRLMFRRYLKRALELTEKPWTKTPDFASTVQVIYDDVEAAEAIARVTDEALDTAFDYETNMLKPDSDKARIVCASLSNGKDTIAFPWHGKAIKAMKNFVRSGLQKVGAGIKFEERWTRRFLGSPVNNWTWDTLLGAHVLDFRKGVTSVKFQALALLGQASYNDHIAPYLRAKGKGGNTPNRIDEVRLEDLLQYCALDSLLELKISQLQRKRL